VKPLVVFWFVLSSLFSVSVTRAQTAFRDATPQWKLQHAEFFEQKYTKLLQAKKRGEETPSCNERATRAEAKTVLSYLQSLDSTKLTPSEVCHQKRLETKVHAILGGLFRDGAEAKTMFTMLKRNMSDPHLKTCPEMVLAYVRTIADFTEITGRFVVMMRLGVDLKAEVKIALSELENLKRMPSGVSGSEYQRLRKILLDY